MTDQGFGRLQELEKENQCLLRELEEENRRLREHEKESRQQQESGDEDLIQKRLIPKMNDTTFLDIGSYFQLSAAPPKSLSCWMQLISYVCSTTIWKK